DARGRADHGETGISAKPLGELTHGELLAPRELDCALPAALAGVAFGDFRQRPVGIEARGIVAERDRERGDGVIVVNEAVEPRPLGARLLYRVADHDEAGRQNLQVITGTSGLLGAGLDVGVELAPGGEVRLRREHGFRCFRRELAAGLRGPGLDDNRPALDRARDVERAAYRQVFALVVEDMQLVGVEIKSALGVAGGGVVRPTLAKTGHYVVEFARAGVALAMLHVVVQPEIACRIRIGGGDDVPAG